MGLHYRNRLGHSASPYLLQHKDNPVHWQPWDDEALKAARALDRPILLSIGYAACHWCHVMAHESFENPDIAALMNRLYLNIKVDREERPDVDQIYMAALTAMGEQGGWPLTMVLTPDGQPFWGGTYFPPEPRYGRPGFEDVLIRVEAAWRMRRDEIEANARRLRDHLTIRLAGAADPARLSPEQVRAFSGQVSSLYDSGSGGLSGAPKFPNAPFLETLWRAWLRDGDTTARDRFLETVTAISLGGIYDHIGGGIARYAVDGRWLVPHFEKMLYDNAHYIRHCLWAFSQTSSTLFRLRIEETIAWLEREMLCETGGFAASLDADSEGQEGKYYVWSAEEIGDLLDDAASDFSSVYGITDRGNWEGANIPNLYELRTDRNAAVDAIRTHAGARALLLARRLTRIPPQRDTKVLSDWNGYAIRAIAESARHFGNESWMKLAQDQFLDLKSAVLGEQRLAHVFDGENASDFGFATDYAAMINAALSLFEATGSISYRNDAEKLASLLRENHYDHESNRGFWMQEMNRSDTPMRTWNDIDEANPSGTAQIIEALGRLALATDDAHLSDELAKLSAHAGGRILQSRFGQAGFMNSADTLMAAKKLVVVGGDRNADALWTRANSIPDPRRVDIFHEQEKAPDGFNHPGAYLCAGMSCSPPVTDPDALEKLLQPGSESG